MEITRNKPLTIWHRSNTDSKLTMAPIRVALIGLSSSSKVAWASGAHLPYLLSPRGRAKFEIVALLNSSVDAARSAIAAFDLPATTKAYGDPASLALDPDVDLVVCNTRVDKHYDTILPSLEAGKHVYCEWPLAHDAAHARELVNAANKSGSRTVVGVQGRVAPVTLKLRELLEAGRIGRVLSSEVRASGGTISRDELPSTLAYFAHREVGGNVYTIGFAHCPSPPPLSFHLHHPAASETNNSCLQYSTSSKPSSAPSPRRAPASRPSAHASPSATARPAPSSTPSPRTCPT